MISVATSSGSGARMSRLEYRRNGPDLRATHAVRRPTRWALARSHAPRPPLHASLWAHIQPPERVVDVRMRLEDPDGVGAEDRIERL